MGRQDRKKVGKKAPRRKTPQVARGKKSATVQRPAARMAPPPSSYGALLEDIKARIRAARVKAALSVNRELIALYWQIGRAIVERQRAEGWGRSVVERLSDGILSEFPGLSGFSAGNIWRMRSLYLAWTEEAANLQQAIGEPADENLAQLVREIDGRNLPQPVGEIPWGHNIVLFEKLKDPAQRLWYALKTVENGWSRAVLVHQIETDAFARQGGAVTNFPGTLPAPQSDLARQLLKDPYHLDFLDAADDISERQLHRGLVQHLRDFLIELGRGFAFVGGECRLAVADEDYYLDLLFYHLRLHCYVVIELKVEEFKPEFAGKMNFYLSAVDDQFRDEAVDGPSIGLILCREHNRIVVEYALRDARRPMGVARYEIKTTRRLPRRLQGDLPTPAELRDELRKAENGKEARRGD